MVATSDAVSEKLAELLHPQLRVRLDDYLTLGNEVSIHLSPTGADAFVAGGDAQGLAYPAFRTILMNDSAARLLTLCDGSRSVVDLIQALADSSLDNLQDVARLTLPFLAQATDQGILTIHEHRVPTSVRVTGSLDYYVPLHAMIELTPSCHVGCSGCPRPGSPDGPADLSTDQWLSILGRLHESGVRVLELAGIEPMARHDFYDIWDFCVERFSLVALLTSGRHIDESAGERLAAGHAGRVIVQVGLDGSTAESHDRLRGPGSFQIVKRAIGTLVKGGVPTRVAMRVDRETAGDVENTLLLARRLGARWFAPVLAVDLGGAQDTSRLQLGEFVQWSEFVEQTVERHGDFVPCLPGAGLRTQGVLGNCGAGYRSVVVGATGMVRSCPLFDEEGMSVGSLCGEDLRRVFDQPLVAYMRDLRAPGPETCSGCPFELYCRGCHFRAIYVQRFAEKLGLVCTWVEENDVREWVDFSTISTSDHGAVCPIRHGFALTERPDGVARPRGWER